MPAQLGHQLMRKQYTAATQALISALALSEGPLAGVEALRDVRAELQAKKQALHSKLMEVLKILIMNKNWGFLTAEEILMLSEGDIIIL